MDTTEKDIRNLFSNNGQLDRDEVAMLLLQLVERIQNLERAPQRTWERPWVSLTDKEIAWEFPDGFYGEKITRFARSIEAKLKEKNT